MIALHILSLVLGVAVTLAVLGSALETVVLPQEGFSRISQAVFAAAYRVLVHRNSSQAEVRTLRSLYAPVSLVSLPLVWMIFMVIAFTFVFWGTGNETFQRAFEHSASSLTTLGFSEPNGTGKIVIAFVEATIGLGLVALLISYLPTIFTAYNSREKGINRLRPIAGAPPNATQLLQTLHRIGSLEGIDFWRAQADWLLDLEQTHTAFPVLTYFPETHTDHSWVATVGSLLDAAALVVATTDDEGDEVYQDAEKGPIMVVVYGLPLIVRIARAANVPLPPRTDSPTSAPGRPCRHPTSPSRAPSSTVHWTPWMPSSPSRRAAATRRGAGSPSSGPSTSRRSAPWPASPRPRPHPGRRTVRPTSAGRVSSAAGRSTWTGQRRRPRRPRLSATPLQVAEAA